MKVIIINNNVTAALRYELMLKEENAKSSSKGAITPDRINLCFEIFGQWIRLVHVI